LEIIKGVWLRDFCEKGESVLRVNLVMVNAKFKFVAGQAKTIILYRNTRSKLLKCNATIYFNKNRRIL
jgi:hypothetical protein